MPVQITGQMAGQMTSQMTGQMTGLITGKTFNQASTRQPPPSLPKESELNAFWMQTLSDEVLQADSIGGNFANLARYRDESCKSTKSWPVRKSGLGTKQLPHK